MGGGSNVHVVRGESFSSFVTSMVKMMRSGGLTDPSNVSGSGVSLFFCGVSEINFLMSSGIIANLHDLLLVYSLSVLEDIMSVTPSDITSYFSPLSVYCGDKYVALDVRDFRSTSDDCGSAAC